MCVVSQTYPVVLLLLTQIPFAKLLTVFVTWDSVSCSPGCPQTLTLSSWSSYSTSRVLGWQVCTTTNSLCGAGKGYQGFTRIVWGRFTVSAPWVFSRSRTNLIHLRSSLLYVIFVRIQQQYACVGLCVDSIFYLLILHFALLDHMFWGILAHFSELNILFNLKIT